jgi:hypothetical protein
MTDHWEKALACATQCARCGETLGRAEPRFLSLDDHAPICAGCRRAEERGPDYEDRAKQMIAECIAATGRPYGDPAGFCFHHFCPFTCRG